MKLTESTLKRIVKEELLTESMPTPNWNNANELPFDKGSTEIWYMKPNFFRDGSMGFDWLKDYGPMPTRKNLKKTHVLLGKVKEKDLDMIHLMFQGSNWSPGGEARTIIKRKGLKHTSMYVGDVIVIGNIGYIVDTVKFEKIPDK